MSVPGNEAQQMARDIAAQIQRDSRLGSTISNDRLMAAAQVPGSAVSAIFNATSSLGSIPTTMTSPFVLSPTQAQGLMHSPVFSGMQRAIAGGAPAYAQRTAEQQRTLNNMVTSPSPAVQSILRDLAASPTNPIRAIEMPTFSELAAFGVKLGMGALKILLGWEESHAPREGVLNRDRMSEMQPEPHIAAVSDELRNQGVGVSTETLAAFDDQDKVTKAMNHPDALLTAKERQQMLDLGPEFERAIAQSFESDFKKLLATAQDVAEKHGYTPEQCAEVRNDLIAMKFGVIAHESLAVLRAAFQTSRSASDIVEHVKGVITNDPDRILAANPVERAKGKHHDSEKTHAVEFASERTKAALAEMKDTARTTEATIGKDLSADPMGNTPRSSGPR